MSVSGNVLRMSTVRIMARSTRPPAWPATTPYSTPKARATTVATSPTPNETIPPCSRRERTSRPRISVPNQWLAQGATAPRPRSCFW